MQCSKKIVDEFPPSPFLYFLELFNYFKAFSSKKMIKLCKLSNDNIYWHRLNLLSTHKILSQKEKLFDHKFKLEKMVIKFSINRKTMVTFYYNYSLFDEKQFVTVLTTITLALIDDQLKDYSNVKTYWPITYAV